MSYGFILQFRNAFSEKFNSYAEKFFNNYRYNLIISSLFLVLMIGFLFYSYTQNGDIVTRGVDFKGGYQYLFSYENVSGSVDEHIRYMDSLYPGIVIQEIEDKKQLLIEYHEDIDTSYLTSQGAELLYKRKISSSLGDTFWREGIKLLLISYFLVMVVVFVLFRTLVPSIAVVLAGLSDILFALSFMNVANIPLTMGTLAALLILIGYSVDTDILLTTRTIKEKPKNINGALISSLKTGMTMTVTSIVAMFALLIFSTSFELDRIAMVIIAGLFADLIFTWFQNASIIKWYLMRRR